MKVRFKFSADLIIEGRDMQEVGCKWEGMPLFSKEADDCGVEFSEVLLIEDAETNVDLWNEYHNN